MYLWHIPENLVMEENVAKIVSLHTVHLVFFFGMESTVGTQQF